MQKSIVLLSFCILITGCASIKSPQIKGVDNFGVSELSSEMKMTFNVNVKNPNNYGLKIRRMNMEVLLDDSVVSSVALLGRQRIPASGNVSLPFEVRPKLIKFPKLALAGIKQLFSDSDNKFKLRGEIVVSKFIFRKRYSFSLP